MKTPIAKLFSVLLSVCIAAVGFPRAAAPTTSSTIVAHGAASPEAAAALVLPARAAPAALSPSVRGTLRSGAFAYALAQPDTTADEGFEFPEEEESHLARDITAFVIASAFVAFFIIKVFLEGDTDEEPTDSGGKTIPGQ